MREGIAAGAPRGGGLRGPAGSRARVDPIGSTSGTEGSARAMRTVPLDHESLRIDPRGRRPALHAPAAGGLRPSDAGPSTIPPPRTSIRPSARRSPGSAWPPSTRRSRPWWRPAWRPSCRPAPATPAPATTPAATPIITSVACAPGTVHDLPTHFDPDLVARLDPQLADYLSRQGFQVTGYRLELVGYQEPASGRGATRRRMTLGRRRHG